MYITSLVFAVGNAYFKETRVYLNSLKIIENIKSRGINGWYLMELTEVLCHHVTPIFGESILLFKINVLF